MRQSLHLLIVEPSSGKALASWTRSRWVLPILTLPEHVRAGQPVATWAANVGLRVQVLGQWLGQAAPNLQSIDWLAVAQVEPTLMLVSMEGLRWCPLDELTSSASWVDYQQWALTEATSRSALPHVPGPFGTMSWLGAVSNWAEDVLGSPLTAPVTSYRTTAYEVALGLATGRGRVFFKGLCADRASEASVTSELHDSAPDAFTPTLALYRQPDGAVWWLTEASVGTALADDLTVEGAKRVAAACSRLQREASGRLPDLVRRRPRADMRTLAAWGTTLLRESDVLPSVETHERAIEEACAVVDSANVPDTLIPVDLDPSNVFLRGDQVRFIDLDEVHRGPSPLAAVMFATRFARAIGSGGGLLETREAIYRAYEGGWAPPLRMRGLWPAFEVVSALFEAHLGWTRVQKKTVRGEIRGVERLVRTTISRRLVRATSAILERSLI